MQPSPPLAPLPETLLSDAPVTTQEADEFQRYPFAQRIAATIRTRPDAASLVLGLYGKWGSGKTSVLHFIEHELVGSDIITMVFNPWLFSGEEQLLLGFFAELGEKLAPLGAIGTQAATEAIHAYSKKVAARAGVFRDQGTPELGRVFESSAALEGIKQQLRETLRSSGKRILVLIDDIDRLDKHEIHSILRLVKLTGDFAYTTYLLAFDDAMVARAVGERYPEGGSEAGYQFLEKIIQVPLRLPVIQQEVLRTYFRKKLSTCLELLDLNLTPEQMQRVEDALARSVLARDVTPRDISRYTNTLLVVLPMLRGEANMADLLLAEALKVFYPAQYKLAASQQHTLTGAAESRQNETTRKEYDSIYGTAGSDLGTALALFKALFPTMAQVYSIRHSIWGTGRLRTEEELYKTKSIASTYYFKRYFSYAVQPGEIPDSSFGFLQAALQAHDKEETTVVAKEMISRSSDKELIRRLEDTHKQVTPQEAAAYCQLLVDISPLFTDEITHSQFGQSLSKVNGLFLSYFLNIPTEQDKLIICERFIKEGAFKTGYSLLFQISRLRQWDDEIGDELATGIAFFTIERFDYLTGMLIKRALEMAEDKPLYEVFGPLSRYLLDLWQEAAGTTATSNYLCGLLAKSPTQLPRFLQHMSYTQSIGEESFFGPLDRESYQLIETVVDADYLYSLAQQQKEGAPWVPPLRRRVYKPSDAERIQQFIYFHDNPEKKEDTESQEVED